MDLPRRTVSILPALLAVPLLIAACAAGGASGAPADGSPPSDVASALPGAPHEIATACITLGTVDCERARALALAELTPADPPPLYVQVGPFGCAEGVERCPATLVARPEGDVVVEFAGGTGFSVHLKVGAGDAIEATRSEPMGIAVAPTSPQGIPAGPQQIELGHCGIFSGLDHGGSWWDPVGPIESDSGESVNAGSGIITVTDPNHATYVGQGGLALQLIRRDGAKLLPFCR
jgi:hypothetical protein